MRPGNYAFVGGTHGIGKAAAQAVSPGSSILLVARDPVAGDAAVRELRDQGGGRPSIFSPPTYRPSRA